jgi:O-methyltransferase
MIGRILNRLLLPFGYGICSLKSSENQLPDEFVKFESIVRSNTMLPTSVLFSLYEQVAFCEAKQIDGDYVECGVWKGGAVGIMALVNLSYSQTRRRIHLFDAFEEICEPDEKIDGARAIQETKDFASSDSLEGRLTPLRGIYDRFGGPGSIEIVRRLLEEKIRYPSSLLFYHKGWFQDTVPEVSKRIDRIAILRLDGDWYASTKVCLDHLLDKVVPGGIVIFDDYGAYEGCKKAVDEALSQRNMVRYLHTVNGESRYMVV